MWGGSFEHPKQIFKLMVREKNHPILLKKITHMYLDYS